MAWEDRMRAAWREARKWALRVATAWAEVRLRLAREEEFMPQGGMNSPEHTCTREELHINAEDAPADGPSTTTSRTLIGYT